jgi:ABC-type glycerol-3-phosphate transport system substrate-binding protein
MAVMRNSQGRFAVGFHRVVLVLLRALLFTSLLAGCGGKTASPTPRTALTPTLTRIPALLPTRPATSTPETQAKVSIWTSWAPDELDALRSVIALFREQHPEFEFSLSYYPQDRLLDAYLACLTSGGCPTILVGPSTWGPLLVERDAVIDVSAFIDPQLQNDLYPVAWAQVISGEVMTGLPLELQGNVLYRNSTLVPDRSTQLGGLIGDAIALREETMQASVFDLGFYNSAPFLAACEGSLFSPDGELAVAGPTGLCWLEMLGTWEKAGRVIIGGDEDRSAFVEGKSGWLIDSSLLLGTLTRTLGADSLTVDPWPLLTSTGEPLKGYVWTENVYISSRIEMGDLEASWAFARFLFEPESQAILSDPEGAAHIPAQESVTIENSRMQTISAMLRSGIPLPIRPDLADFIGPIETLINSVVLKGADPQQGLNVLSARVATPTPTSTPTP